MYATLINNLFRFPESSWRIPRPFKSALECFDWGKSIGSTIITWRLVTDWCALINPGDRVECIEATDYSVRQSGIVTFVKHLMVKDMLREDIVGLLPVEYRELISQFVNPEIAARMMSYFYGEPISLDDQIAVIGLRLEYATPGTPDGSQDRLEHFFRYFNIPLKDPR